jgi:6-phosphogluconolactonase (cycloisomerase 2 family)
LFAANQDSNTIDLFQIDQLSGRLIATSRLLKVVAPVCVRIVSFR